MTVSQPFEVMRTPLGRYVWWPALNILEYYQKGSRKPDRSWPVIGKNNCLTRVMRRAATLERDRTFRQSQTWQ